MTQVQETALCIIIAIIVLCVWAYNFGKDDGYERGYNEAVADLKFEFDEQNNQT